MFVRAYLVQYLETVNAKTRDCCCMKAYKGGGGC